MSRDFTWEDPEVAAGLFLIGIWDKMGIVGDDGRTGVSVIACPWNLADTGKEAGHVYAMTAAEKPWRPEVRSQVLKRALDAPSFAQDAELSSWRGKIATAKPVGGRVRFSPLSGHDTYPVDFPRAKR